MGKVWNLAEIVLGVGGLGFEAHHWDPKPPRALAIENQRIGFRHSGTDQM